MMDQQNFEAARPVSADPAVALAQALGQMPKPTQKITPRTTPKTGAGAVAKTASVEALAQELGLRLGDQNQLTIRRIKRGRSYSFVRANGTAVRHAGTIRRLHSMAVPPAYAEVRYSPDPSSHLQAVGRDAAGRLQYRYHSDWEKVREQRKAHRLARLVAALPKIRRNVSMHLSATPRPVNCALGGDRTDRAHRDPSGQQILCAAERHRGATTLLKSNVTLEDDSVVLSFKAKGGRPCARMRCRETGARHRHPARRAWQAHVPVPRQFRHGSRGLDHHGERIPARSPASDFAEGFPHLDGISRGAGSLSRISPAASARGRRKQVLDAVRAAADELSNTPAICRKSYVATPSSPRSRTASSSASPRR
jgi:DNA topoisomerase-1